MPHLVIEYVLNGERPGYTLKPSPNSFDEATLKAIWRQAMPRGQGWGTETYRGAYSLKCFPVGRHRVAVSEVRVTELEDEEGRRGIRRAEITLLSVRDYLRYLRDKLAVFPDWVHFAAGRMLTLSRWSQIIDKALPGMRRKTPQIILAYPYSEPGSWQIVEALILKLATSWKLRALPGWGHAHSLTTLALSHWDESQIVALPLEKASQARDVPIIPLW